MSGKGHLVVISCGIGANYINPAMINIVSKACVLAGSSDLTCIFPEFGGDVVVLDSNLSKSIDALVERAKHENIVVLVNGDALFMDIGKTFADKMDSNGLTIIPNITAMQSFLSKLKVSTNETSFFSLQGKNKILPYRDILSRKSAVIYCDKRFKASDIVRELLKECNVGERLGAIAEDLGTANERIIVDSLIKLSSSDSSNISMLYLYPVGDDKPVLDRGIALGLGSESYDHESNLMVQSEARPVILSKLKLGSGVMWDIGAGSGTVSIEASSIVPDLKVYAVEKSSGEIKHIKENIRDFGRVNVEVVHEEVLNAIDHLPNPRSVFIGGGGPNIKKIIEKSYKKLRSGGRIVVGVKTPEAMREVRNVTDCGFVDVVALSVEKSCDIKAELDQTVDKVNLYTFEKPFNL